MAEENTTHVRYKAMADFADLINKARQAKRALQSLEREQVKANKGTVKAEKEATDATKKHTAAREDLIDAFEESATSIGKSTKEFISNTSEMNKNTNAVKQNRDERGRFISGHNEMKNAMNATSAASDRLNNTIAVTSQRFRKVNGEWKEVINNTKRSKNELGGLTGVLNKVHGGLSKVHQSFRKFGNWRPRLTPPFVALIPLIAGVLALINPLVAGLGAVGAAAIGFASSLGRVAAGAIAAIPALTTLLSVIAALKMSFGGIGNAFKAFSDMKKATGGGGGGGGGPAQAELTRTEQLQRAQENYARAIQDVLFAQEDLDEARKGYIKRLRELQKAVDRAAMSEARAAANSQLARENYNNVLADPGSTKGQKMDATVGVQESEAEFRDTLDEIKEQSEALNKMKQDGMAGDRDIIMANRRLTDAIWAQRDAQLALINAQRGSAGAGGAAAGAINAYEDAMSKLSPSARKFVETLLSMQDAWTAIRRNVQEAFFSKFVNEVGLLRNILPSVESLLTSTAGALGNVVKNLLLLITSPDWQRDLVLIGEQNVPIIENIGRALLAWVDAFKNLSIAAGPFLIALTDGLAKGAENFAAIVDNARKNGSLADYLEKVRERMSQWWRIVKNIGKALFNFSAAASDFGTWLTDGFERVTEGWLRSSEKAREAGSPFKKFLEDIKPAVTAVRELFADFFKWFARTAADPKNIKGFTDLVATLREDFGPALSGMLQSLTDSGLGDKLAESLGAIFRAIASFVEGGAGEGFKAFFDVVSGFFNWLAAVLANPMVGSFLKVVGPIFGTLAALSFIGKFTGLTNLFGWILKLAGIPSVLTFLSGLVGLKGLSGLNLAGLGGLGGLGGGKPGAGSPPIVGGGAGKPGVGGLGAIPTGFFGMLLSTIGVGLSQGIVEVDKSMVEKTRNTKPGLLGNATDEEVLAYFNEKNSKSGLDEMLNPTKLPDSFKQPSSASGAAPKEQGRRSSGGAFVSGGMPSMAGYTAELRKVGDAYTYVLVKTKEYELSVADANEQTTTATSIQAALVQSLVDRAAAEEALKEAVATTAAAQAEALTALDSALETNGRHWEDGTLAAERNKLAVYEYASASSEAAEALRRSGGSYDEYKAKLEESRKKIYDSIIAMGGSEEAARKVASAIVKIPSHKMFDLQNNIDATRKKVEDFYNRWNGQTIKASYWMDIGYNRADAAAVARLTGQAMYYLNQHKGGLVPKTLYRAGGGPIQRGEVTRGQYMFQPKGTDTVPAMLTPNEFIIRAEKVKEVGADNLSDFNTGRKSYEEMLAEAVRRRGGMSFLSGGGLVPSIRSATTENEGVSHRFTPGDTSSTVNSGVTVENLTIQYPEPEPASDTLPRTIRSLAYVHGGA